METKTKNWVTYLFLASFALMVALHFVKRSVTDRTLSEHFEMGSQCISLLSISPDSNWSDQGKQNEAECYGYAFQNHLQALNEDDQVDYLKRTLAAYQAAGRLNKRNAVVLTQVVSAIPRADSVTSRFTIIDEILTIAEACQNSKLDVLSVLSYLRPEMLEGLPITPETQGLAQVLKNRYTFVKDRWIIQEADVTAYVAKRVQHEL